MKLRNILVILLVLTALATSFTGCSTDTLEEHYAELDTGIAAANVKFDTAFVDLQYAQCYSYTVQLYFEEMYNFDHENRLMPKEQTPAEDKCWYKPIITYTYKKSGENVYVEVILSDMIIAVSGQNSNGGNEYEQAMTDDLIFVYKLKDGVQTMMVDGANVSACPSKINDLLTNFGLFYYGMSSDIAYGNLDGLCDEGRLSDCVFMAESKNFLGQNIGMYQNYYVVNLDGTKTPYRQSEYISGFGEDLDFDWENIQGVDILTSCVTLKNNKLSTFELYYEYISSYNKTVNQVWNDRTVINWYGDRTAASKMVVEFNYDDVVID